MNMEEPEPIILSRDEYRKNIEDHYFLCNAWFSGTISNEEFIRCEWWLLTRGGIDEIDLPAVEYEEPNTPEEVEEQTVLDNETRRVANLTDTVIMAYTEMQWEGLGDSRSPLMRAFYFAKNWSSLGRSADELSPCPVWNLDKH